MYEWIKALHVIAVIAWMAGMLYFAAAVRLSLRRRSWIEAIRNLQGDGTAAAEGDHQPGDDRDLAGGTLPRLGWPLVLGGLAACKLLLVLVLSGVHGFFSRCVKDFAADRNPRRQKFYV